MCDNCGANHDTGAVEDPEVFDAFLARLIAYLAPEVKDYMEEYRTEPDVTISGEDWAIKVAKVGGTSDVLEAYDPGEQWIINQYEDDELIDSTVVHAAKPKSTQQTAEEFASSMYGYPI